MAVRVRFAPSPTGTLHIGSARAALFNWLYAKAQGGQFILRIEDTDQARSQHELLEGILEDLRWLGISWDEGPIHQSERMDHYRHWADQLLEKGLAYQEKDAQKGTAIKFRVPSGKVVIQDLIHQEVVFSNEELDDIVLIKSDGTATYQFACVVDDHEMNISHCIRGDDHLPNTPKQVLLYQALGWRPPKFAHIPLILSGGEEGGRLSKRKGAQGIKHFRDQGFIPIGMVNAISLLGFSPGASEVVNLEQLLKSFKLKKLTKKSAHFDYDKMSWINAQHIKKLPLEALVEQSKPFLAESLGEQAIQDSAYVAQVIKLFQGRIRVLSELPTFAAFFFKEDLSFTDEARTLLQVEGPKKILTSLIPVLEALEPFKEDIIEQHLRDFTKSQGLSGKDWIHLMRAAVTGQTVSPGLFEVLALLGKQRVLSRLKSQVS